MSFNQKEYIDNYNKQTYKMYPFRVRKDDIQLIEKLDSLSNRNSYITSLIKEDIDPSILTIKQIKQRIKPVMEKHGIKEVYLFGSYARGEANRNSDVDIYCDSGDVGSLLDHVEFEGELEEALGKKVDVIFFRATMHEFFRKQLEEDMIKIFL